MKKEKKNQNTSDWLHANDQWKYFKTFNMLTCGSNRKHLALDILKKFYIMQIKWKL